MSMPSFALRMSFRVQTIAPVCASSAKTFVSVAP